MREKFTYANVMATIAVFLALGGVGYAAGKLGKNTVGTKQIKKNAVNGSKVADHSLTGADIAASTLQGLAGKNGQNGQDGAPGPPGAPGSPAASMLTGRFPEGSDFASPSGTTAGFHSVSEVDMLSPAAPVVARDLAVRSDGDLDGTETVTLSLNGTDTTLSCQMSNTGSVGTPASCQDTAHAVTIPPGSEIALHYVLTNSSGGLGGGIVRFGWRATTP